MEEEKDGFGKEMKKIVIAHYKYILKIKIIKTYSDLSMFLY